jgi:methylenetetrahydrofolate dehydrogenase (NADP+) / methenyltetrahydrofolate cyclohydrolase
MKPPEAMPAVIELERTAVAGAQIIDGIAVSKVVRAECRARVKRLNDFGIVPALAVIMVGNDSASAIYVRNKTRACGEVGIRSERFLFDESVEASAVIDRIRALNDDPTIHGILFQLPLPSDISLQPVLHAIDPKKDVDGFHLYNVGALVAGEAVFPPCTPFGVLRMLEHQGIALEGRNVVVVGASNIVGKPMALMLMQRDATVCICHAKTRDLAQFTILADILVVAAGHPNLILPQMVKTGAVVIDVGINRLPNGRVVGDVDFEGVRKKASFITPVPGGVGPMTVTMLLANTIVSAERAISDVSLGAANSHG